MLEAQGPEITLSEPQSQIFASNARFKVVAAGRRFGKTVMSLYTILYEASVPKSKIFYVTVSYRAAKSILWQELKEVLYKTNWVTVINEADLHVKLRNGSQLSLRGADNPDSLRGVGLSAVVLDECAFMSKKTWTEVLRPALSDTGGSAMFISSPAGRSNFFYDLWELGRKGEPGWESWQFTTLEGGNVPADEIEAARRDLDEKTFKQEYEATFESYTGLVYPNFHYEESVKKKEYEKGRQVLVGMDFNIDPMSAVVMQKDHDKLHVIDEVVIYSSNTDEMADELRYRYPVNDCIVYPDPAAVQRKTSAGGKTDISILQNAGFRVRYPNAHPAIRDRVNAVNSRFKTADGKRHLFIDPKCKTLIDSLSKQIYKPETAIPDKSGGYDHACFRASQKVKTPNGLVAFVDLPAEGKIITWNNKAVRYIHCKKTGFKRTITLVLASGKTITCTPEHQILGIHGWMLAEDCRIGERLCKPNSSYKFPKPSEISAREDIEILMDGLPYEFKLKFTHDVVVGKFFNDKREDVYCLYVPRYQCFQLECGTTVSNCDALSYAVNYLHPVRRSGKSISTIRLGGL